LARFFTFEVFFPVSPGLAGKGSPPTSPPACCQIDVQTRAMSLTDCEKLSEATPNGRERSSNAEADRGRPSGV
jgi:hypothetical protein